MIISEQEKNRIRNLHREYFVLNEEMVSDFEDIKDNGWVRKLEQMYDPFKEVLFKHWDNEGPHNDPHMLKLLGFDTRKEKGLYKIIDLWLVEWHGGWDKAVEVSKERLKGIHEVSDGGYNFKYVVTSIDAAEEQVQTGGWSSLGVFVIVDGNGTANLALGGHDTYTLWEIFHDHHWWSDGDYEEECRKCGLRRSVYDDESDLERANRVSDVPGEDLKYEVQQEVDEVVHENLIGLLRGTGIRINYVTIEGSTAPNQFPPKEGGSGADSPYIQESTDMFGQELLELQSYITEEEQEDLPSEDEEKYCFTDNLELKLLSTGKTVTGPKWWQFWKKENKSYNPTLKQKRDRQNSEHKKRGKVIKGCKIYNI
tara:strand:+ start:150 stop:1253 length:1104 start_codon:yes stop_codon:yes gene_type:complete